MSPTSLDFSIETKSVTGQRKVTQSLLALGALAFMCSAPSGPLRQWSPSAVRPAIIVETQKGYRQTYEVERSVGRLRVFAKYGEDWDSHGAARPNAAAINAALQYLTLLEPWHAPPLATLSRQGEPVLEFEDTSTGLFGSIRFISDKIVELYSKEEEEASLFLEGDITSNEVKAFLSDTMKLPTA